MNRRGFLHAVSAAAVAPGVANAGQSRSTALPPTGLLCELMEQPHLAVITTRQPRFGWIVNDAAPNATQSAYQILVASSREIIDRDLGDAKRAASWRHPADFWDSGKVTSTESVNVPYGGKALGSDWSYWWKVRTWNQRGQGSAWSAPQPFRLGRLNDEYATARYPLEMQAIAPLRVVKKGEGHYFVEFAKAAFGTLRFIFNDGAGGAVTVELSEHRSAPDEVWRPTPADLRARSSIGYLKTTMQFSGSREAVTLRLPERSRPTREELPFGIASVMPFRFVELINCPNTITKDNVRQLAVFYHFNGDASRFASSSKVLNDVWDLCKYSMKATSFCGVYVDGHRERLPYEADAYLNQLGHYCVDREFTLARHSHEWLITHPTWPTEWITHSVLMAWADFMHTGDAASLRRSLSTSMTTSTTP